MVRNLLQMFLSDDLSVPVKLSTLPVEPDEIVSMLQNKFSTSIFDFLRAAQTEVRPWWSIKVASSKGTAHYLIARDAIRGSNERVTLSGHALSVCRLGEHPVIALVSLPAAAVDRGIKPKAQVAARVTKDMFTTAFWGNIRMGGTVGMLTGAAAMALGAILLPVVPPAGIATIAAGGAGVATGMVMSEAARSRIRKSGTAAISGVKELFAHRIISRSFEPLANVVGSAVVSGNTLYVTGYHSLGDRVRGVVGIEEGGIFVSGTPTGDALDTLLEFSKKAKSTVWVYDPSPQRARIIRYEKGKTKEYLGHIPEGITQIEMREVLFQQPEAEIIPLEEMPRVPTQQEQQ